jgi:hypothetical protein
VPILNSSGDRTTTNRNLWVGATIATITAPTGGMTARRAKLLIRFDGVTGPNANSLMTVSLSAIGCASGWGTDNAWGRDATFSPGTTPRVIESDEFVLPALTAGGTFSVALKSNNSGDNVVPVGCSILDLGAIDAAGGGGGSSWTGLFPPREMSGDRIGFSHPDSGTFYYLVNNAADATPTTFAGDASGSTRSVLRTTVAADVADGFSVLTVYKQVGGSVVHASDTPVGAILVNKTAGTVTERLLTQTELAAIGAAAGGSGSGVAD